MKRFARSCPALCLVIGLGLVGAAVAAPLDGWEPFVIRNATATGNPPLINTFADPDSRVEFIITESGQKAGLGTDALNGLTVSQIAALHLDRLDEVATSGSLYGPYFNIWVTDGAGHYAVIANEPSNPEWAADRWFCGSWDDLRIKTCKVYETPGAGAGTSWVHVYAGLSSGLTFDDVAGLIISPPPPSYILEPANAVGSGAPDVLGTNVAYGYNWMFGDTLANYVSGDPGFLAGNYYLYSSYPVHNVTQVTSYLTIAAALAAAGAGDLIEVSAGYFPENLTIGVPLTLRSVATAPAAATIAGAGGAVIAIQAGDVTVEGFRIINPSGTYAITATDRSGLAIRDNTIEYIGNSALSSYVHAVAVVCSAAPVDDVVIEGNTFNYIEAGPYSSASAISAGWSTGAQMFTNLVIQDNHISRVRSNTQPWNVGHGAYGILLNHGTGTTGQTIGAQILDNTIDDLEGLWAHGIGLEGNTPGAVVSGNVITNLVDHKTPSDAVAIMVEDNASLASVAIHGNTFGNVAVGVMNAVGGPGVVDAADNDWGAASGPFHADRNPGGTGAAVSDYVLFTPWVGRAVTLVADLGIDPSTRTLADDGYGYWEGTPALGLDGDNAPGFAPGAFQAQVTAVDPIKYTKYGFLPATVFGRPVKVGELHSITYFTRKGSDHVSSPPDWFCQMYTEGTAHGWYGERINAEPYFAENLTETPGTWTRWATAAGEDNRLRFFDSNLGLGSYTDGFLVDLTGNPFYAAQPIMLFGLGTGSAWAEGFDGRLDGLTVELVSGEQATFNFISGNAAVSVLPPASGPIMCGDTVTLAFRYTPDAYTPAMRGYEVTFRAGAAVSCGVADIADSGILGTPPNAFFHATDNGDGTFTVTGAILGPTTGLTAEADLFSVTFHGAATGTALVEVTGARLRDLVNNPLGTITASATIEVDCTAPGPVTDIDAAAGHQKVVVTWTEPASDVAAVEVWRGLWYHDALLSVYPEYDDQPGHTVPTRPASRAAAAASAEWTLVATLPAGTGTFTDGVLPRGLYYYELFAVDTAGNYGPPAAANDRALNYWLGDVFPAGTYDGLVDVGDVSVLGAAFATVHGGGAYNNHCDVGPTDTNLPDGVPLTDNRIDLEDLMIFALNYSLVGPAKSTPAAAGPLALAWAPVDETRWALRLVGDCPQLKGLRLTVPLPEGIEANVSAGDLAGRQMAYVFLHGAGGVQLDVNLAIMGAGVGFEGTGDLFVVDLSAPAALGEAKIEARGLQNEKLDPTVTAELPTPSVFSLAQNAPNPFNPSTRIAFSLADARPVRLAVYGVDGRLVRTLLAERRAAGRHEVVWDGRDDGGRTVASGTYFCRIEAGSWLETRKMVLMK